MVSARVVAAQDPGVRNKALVSARGKSLAPGSEDLTLDRETNGPGEEATLNNQALVVGAGEEVEVETEKEVEEVETEIARNNQPSDDYLQGKKSY